MSEKPAGAAPMPEPQYWTLTNRGMVREFTDRSCAHWVTKTDYDALRAECERLERLVYVPGLLKCAKCKCTLISNTLNASSGLVKANNEPQQCPNGCGPMWRVTERDAGNDVCDQLDKAVDALKQAERDVKRWQNEAKINAENFHVTNAALVDYDRKRMEAEAERLRGENAGLHGVMKFLVDTVHKAMEKYRGK